MVICVLSANGAMTLARKSSGTALFCRFFMSQYGCDDDDEDDKGNTWKFLGVHHAWKNIRLF